jgi:hypothetical protein
MTGATRYVAGRHGGIAALKAGWWLLGQPGVVVGLVAGAMAGVVHLPAELCLMTAVVVGGGVAGLTVYRRHIGITAKLQRAMVEVGLVHRKDYRTVDDLVVDDAIAVDPFPAGGTDHVSQCHQSTWQASDVDEASG